MCNRIRCSASAGGVTSNKRMSLPMHHPFKLHAAPARSIVCVPGDGDPCDETMP